MYLRITREAALKYLHVDAVLIGQNGDVFVTVGNNIHNLTAWPEESALRCAFLTDGQMVEIMNGVLHPGSES